LIKADLGHIKPQYLILARKLDDKISYSNIKPGYITKDLNGRLFKKTEMAGDEGLGYCESLADHIANRNSRKG
jgi:hypothetical protein